MSRIKILLLLLITAVLSIVFIQNRQPIPLKILCADISQTCLYRTPSLPLSVWLALSTLTGAVANLLVQTLNRYGYSNSSKRTVLNEDLYPSNQGDYSTKKSSNSVTNDIPQSKIYETKQEPQNVEHSGSNYSYKYREAGAQPKDKNGIQNNLNKSKADLNATTESDDENWI